MLFGALLAELEHIAETPRFFGRGRGIIRQRLSAACIEAGLAL